MRPLSNARAALIGKPLGHSYSKQIHEKFGYSYDLCETEPEDLGALLRSGKYAGFNVTIPYKKEVIKHLDGLDEVARETGAVNTVKVRNTGLFGYNTDAYGLEFLLRTEGFDVAGKKVMVLGTGGTSHTARYVLKKLGAAEIITVGRTSPVNYENCYAVEGVKMILNATPVGMYPDTDGCPIDPARFPSLEGVADVIYNPLNTALVRKARSLGIKACGGLKMLVAQAVRSAEIFTDAKISPAEAEKVYREVRNNSCGVVFIGMPGSGKTTLGRLTAGITGKEFIDTDEEIEKRFGKSIGRIFAEDGEEVFRKAEEDAICAAAKKRSAVVSTGGGAVLRDSNRFAIRENSMVIAVERRVETLEVSGRPLSRSREKLMEMERVRMPIYRDLADFRINNDGDINSALEKIKEFLL